MHRPQKKHLFNITVGKASMDAPMTSAPAIPPISSASSFPIGHRKVKCTMIDMRLREVYRYLGYRKITPTPEIDARIQQCIARMQAAATPRAISRRFPVRTEAPDLVEIAGLTIRSRDLYRNLSGCDDAYMFAATIGVGIDLLIKRGEVASMTDSIIYQAAGAEMIESYADREVAKLRAQEAEHGYQLRPRYSPGYGDLPLALQTDFARILDMQKWCGITLTDALLMVPSKSITAFIGCTRQPKTSPDAAYLAQEVNPLKLENHNCNECSKTDCSFRAV